MGKVQRSLVKGLKRSGPRVTLESLAPPEGGFLGGVKRGISRAQSEPGTCPFCETRKSVKRKLVQPFIQIHIFVESLSAAKLLCECSRFTFRFFESACAPDASL